MDITNESATSRRPLFIAASILFSIILLGLYSFNSLHFELLPKNLKKLTVVTESRQLSPEEIEQGITAWIESALRSTTDVTSVSSESLAGLSIVRAIYPNSSDDKELYNNARMAIDKITTNLPEGMITDIDISNYSDNPLMIIGITSESPRIDSMELRSIAEKNIKKKLIALPGISKVQVIGGDVKQYQVLLDPIKLKLHRVTIDNIHESIRASNINQLGGYATSHYETQLIKHIASLKNQDDLAEVPISVSGDSYIIPLTLKDLARIEVSPLTPKISDASIKGKDSVLVAIYKDNNKSSILFDENIEKVIKDIGKTIPSGIALHADIYKEAALTKIILENYLKIGSYIIAILIVAVLLFSFNFRLVFSVIISILASSAAIILLLNILGLALNLYILAGLILCSGIISYNSIIAHEKPGSESNSFLQLLFITLSIEIISLLPLVILGNLESVFFTHIALSYIITLVISYFISAILIPSLFGKPAIVEETETKKWFGAILDMTFSIGTFSVICSVFLIAVAFASILYLKPIGTPEVNGNNLLINFSTEPGTNINESIRISGIAEKLIRDIPEISSVTRITGVAIGNVKAISPHNSHFMANLKLNKKTKKEIEHEIRRRLNLIPGTNISIKQPIETDFPITITLSGEDFGIITSKINELRKNLARIPGILDLKINTPWQAAEIHALYHSNETGKIEVPKKEVIEQAISAVEGRIISHINEGSGSHDIIVKIDDKTHSDLKDLEQIPINLPGENPPVPLGFIASLYEARGPVVINRAEGRRYARLEINIDKSLFKNVTYDINKIISRFRVPKGYELTVKNTQREDYDLLLKTALGISISTILILILVSFYLGHINFAFQVLWSILFGLAGLIGSLWLTGGTFSLATIIAAVILLGISCRIAIPILFNYLYFIRSKNSYDIELIYSSTQEYTPKLLGNILTIYLMLIPIAIIGPKSGFEILYDIAIPLSGGLISVFIFEILLRPYIFWKFSQNTIKSLFPSILQHDPSEGRDI